MDLTSVLLAPVRVPVRLAQALDDLATIAERARRDPDPVEEVRERIDTLIVELAAVIAVAREIVDGGAELTATARTVNTTGIALDERGREIVSGGRDLTAVALQPEADTRELISGGRDLTEVSKQIEQDLRIFRAALPRLLQGLDTVDELESAVETVADTVEPLQGAAERVGRVTNRLSRR